MVPNPDRLLAARLAANACALACTEAESCVGNGGGAAGAAGGLGEGKRKLMASRRVNDFDGINGRGGCDEKPGSTLEPIVWKVCIPDVW